MSVSLYLVVINLKIHLNPIYRIIIHFNSKHRLKYKRERWIVEFRSIFTIYWRLVGFKQNVNDIWPNANGINTGFVYEASTFPFASRFLAKFIRRILRNDSFTRTFLGCRNLASFSFYLFTIETDVQLDILSLCTSF